jgi:hypothetical protein
MGNGISPAFRKLLEDRKLTRIKPDRKLVLKKMEADKSDLKDAGESKELKKFKPPYYR